MLEIESKQKPSFIIVVPSHGFKEVNGTTYPTTTGLERIIAAHELFTRKQEEGYMTRVIFTGGQRSVDGSIPSTSEVMSGIFLEMLGPNIDIQVDAYGGSRETHNNIAEVIVNLRAEGIPVGTPIVFLSQQYHDIGGRFGRAIQDNSFEYSNARFQSIESLGIDLGLTPESIRFTSFKEFIQSLVIIGGRGADRLFNGGQYKAEKALYPIMAWGRRKSRNI